VQDQDTYYIRNDGIYGGAAFRGNLQDSGGNTVITVSNRTASRMTITNFDSTNSTITVVKTTDLIATRAKISSFEDSVLATSNLPVVYSTFTETAIFTSTDIASGCKVYTDTVTWRPEFDLTMKRIGMQNNERGSYGTCIVGMAVNGVTKSTGTGIVNMSSNSSNLNDWIGSVDIPAGSEVTIWTDITANSGTKSVSYWWSYWRKLW
jgi:hypothetical protein